MSNLRSKFDQELKALIEDIISMSTMLEGTIEKTIKAIVEHDYELAKKIIEEDDIFDNYEHKIERDSVSIISRQQPVAGDLRAVFAIIKIVTELERMADHCAEIARIMLRNNTHNPNRSLRDIPEMADIVKQMIRLTVDSFIEQDTIKAKRVMSSDDIVDQYYVRIYTEGIAEIKVNPEYTEEIHDLVSIAKYFERLADHSTNVAEWVIYIAEGKWLPEISFEDAQ